ncbi:hypothetical protein BC628DRAFT_444499 [Trametes gibbosa]|nr:hypothetical protein BC628DRAFT_444499 [Trametes gibbosa]
MLKRQRSTPSFIQDAPFAAAADPATDAFERAAKRRRQIAPLRRRAAAHGGWSWPAEDTDGEEDVVGDERAPDRLESSEQAQRLEHAGDYRNVNTLLHDLHAEQRHRMLFSSTLPLSDLTFPHGHTHTKHHNLTATTDKRVPAVLQRSASIPEETNMVDHGEVQRVMQRYEDTNRLLGSLFLHRRRQFDTVDLSDQP